MSENKGVLWLNNTVDLNGERRYVPTETMKSRIKDVIVKAFNARGGNGDIRILVESILCDSENGLSVHKEFCSHHIEGLYDEAILGKREQDDTSEEVYSMLNKHAPMLWKKLSSPGSLVAVETLQRFTLFALKSDSGMLAGSCWTECEESIGAGLLLLMASSFHIAGYYEQSDTTLQYAIREATSRGDLPLQGNLDRIQLIINEVEAEETYA
jgi:hypothetical protein